MNQNSNSDIEKLSAGENRDILEPRAATYWKTFAIRIAVERELAREVIRSRQGLESLIQTSSKTERQPSREADSKRRPKKSFVGREASHGVLTTKPQHPYNLREIFESPFIVSDSLASYPEMWIRRRSATQSS